LTITSLKLPSFAKINRLLQVLGKRPDGYHEIFTVLQTISLCDDLEFELRTDGKLTLACDDPRIPTDETNLIIRAATGLPFLDTQCGFKLMDRERVRPVVEKMVVDGFAFDVELLFLCRRFGLAVADVPVTWRNAAGSKVSIVGDPLKMILDVLRVRWRFRRGLYNPESGAAPAP